MDARSKEAISLLRLRTMTQAEIDAQVSATLEEHPTIYVLQYGHTMTLVDFYVLRPVNGSKKDVALKLVKHEYSKELYVEERAIPTERVCTREIHAVRMKNGEVQIHAGIIGWQTVKMWCGNPMYQNTCD